MALAYDEDGLEIPQTELIIEPLSIPLDDEKFWANHKGNHDILTKGKGRYITVKQAEEFDIDTVNEMCREAGIPYMSYTLNRED